MLLATQGSSEMVNSHSRRRTGNQGHLASQHRGVASIEYALLASLIFVAALGAIAATSDANGSLWTSWTGKVVVALSP